MSNPVRKRRARGPVLTSRDVELLVSLCKYRHLSTGQVERLHFPSHQTANRRLRILAKQEYVSAFRVPGIQDRIVCISQKGLDFVARRPDVSVTEIPTSVARTHPKDHYFLRHALALTDFRIALNLACDRCPDIELLGFFGDHVVERSKQGALRNLTRDAAANAARLGAKVSHTPDGVFALRRSDIAALFFLEIDRGTESVSNRERGFAKTLTFYLNFLVGGGYERYETEFDTKAPFKTVRILVLTSSRRRLESIQSAGASLKFDPARALRFIWLAELGTVTDQTIFSLPWVSLDPEDKNAYRIMNEADRTISAEGALAHD